MALGETPKARGEPANSFGGRQCLGERRQSVSPSRQSPSARRRRLSGGGNAFRREGTKAWSHGKAGLSLPEVAGVLPIPLNMPARTPAIPGKRSQVAMDLFELR